MILMRELSKGGENDGLAVKRGHDIKLCIMDKMKHKFVNTMAWHEGKESQFNLALF